MDEIFRNPVDRLKRMAAPPVTLIGLPAGIAALVDRLRPAMAGTVR